MKKRINKMFVVISILAIVLTTGLVTAVYYNLFRRQVTADLKDYTTLVRDMYADTIPEEWGRKLAEGGIRLTRVDSKGNVL